MGLRGIESGAAAAARNERSVTSVALVRKFVRVLSLLRSELPNQSDTRLVADDALELVDRVVLAGDRKQRRRFREIGGIDHGLDFGRDRNRLAVRVFRSDRHLVVAVGPLRVAGVLAVPRERLVLAGVE